MRVPFADFVLDTATRQLLRGDREVHLSPKAFDLLALLIARRPAVVDKETLRDTLWPGTNVVDANLNNLASEIRSALDDDPQQPRFLRTVHRVGYAWVGSDTGQTRVKHGSDTGQTRVRHGSDMGQTSPLVWLIWDDRRIVLETGDQILGRDPQCAIWIDAEGVSRRHARIQVTASEDGTHPSATIEDLDSTNGTFVDGRRVRHPTTLRDGQSIRLGEATLAFRAWSEAGAATKKIRRR